MENIGSNQTLVKVTNQELIISEIRKHGQLSRSELANILKLSNPSISKNVDDLMKKGLLIELGSIKTHIGRRPVMLRFNEKCGCVAAIDLSGEEIRICLSDLSGNIFASVNIPGEKIIRSDTLTIIAERLSLLLFEKKDACGKLLCICIGSPGNIDPVTGKILYALRVEDYQNLDIKSFFSDIFSVPTLVKNDVNLAVKGEHDFGAGQGYESLLYISVDIGVGAGIIISGNLYEGARGFAGEIGMITTERSVPLDEIGSAENIIKNIIKRVKNGEKTSLSSSEEIHFKQIRNALDQGDKLSLEEVQSSAMRMAVILQNINELLDVEMVLIGGSVINFGDIYLNEIRRSSKLLNSNNPADICWGSLGEKAAIYGAIGEASSLAVKNIINGN